jgi:succinoglycan biosynthesis protein ExoM
MTQHPSSHRNEEPPERKAGAGERSPAPDAAPSQPKAVNAGATPVFVDVCVCTFRRPYVAATLVSIAAQVLPPHVRMRVIVADNDEQPSARELVERTARERGLDLEYVHAPARNISVARNACLDHARGGWLAFIDDDETASLGWLAALLARAEESGADVVFGPVNAVYPDGAPAWARAGGFHNTSVVVSGGRIRTGYTGNVLMRRAKLSPSRHRFNLACGKTGGEDTVFFGQLDDAGLRLAYAPEAVIEEPVPAERVSLRWLARRAFRSGQSHAMMLASRGRWPGVLRGALALVKLGVCALGTLAALWSPVRWRKWLLRGAVHAGVAARSLGLRRTVS